MQNIEEIRADLLNREWINKPDDIVLLSDAYERFADAEQVMMIYWWGDRPSGFAHVENIDLYADGLAKVTINDDGKLTVVTKTADTLMLYWSKK